jgi:subtilisin family serine protease
VLVKFARPLDEIGLKNIQNFAEERLGKPIVVKKVGGLNVVSISGSGVDRDKFLQVTTPDSANAKFAIEYVEPDFILKLHSIPRDEFFRNQWGLTNEGQTLAMCGGSPPKGAPIGKKGADINVTSAWAIPAKTREFVSAIIDTGVDYDHADIGANMWRAPMAFDVVIGGVPVHCSAGSHGFNAITNQCDPIERTNSHGTNVAGILAAVTDDKVGTVGVDPQVSVLSVKAFEDDSACVSQIANAIQFITTVKSNPALNADIRVINNSYGLTAETIECKIHETCQSRVLKEAVSTTLSSGILFVASAGNDRRDTDCVPEFPANFDLPNVIAVAASTNMDVLASDFSNFGVMSTHLIAPGQDICAPGIGGYGYHEGTSMAAPFVSGAAALLLSRCGLSLDYANLKKRLIDNADTRSFDFNHKTVAGRRLNIGRAVLTCP